jgi:hypothetical protein
MTTELNLVDKWKSIPWCKWRKIVFRQQTRGQNSKRKNLYAKRKNLADIDIKCTMILTKVMSLKTG